MDQELQQLGYSKSKEELQKHWKTIYSDLKLSMINVWGNRGNSSKQNNLGFSFYRDIDVLITHSPSFNILDLA
jgi:hypothetical protein